jgi:2-polyprenyl-6-methoxyphenol hydroxylase-like FAD-dependent oxidoreductase
MPSTPTDVRGPEHVTTTDVVVIGAGPGGCAAAISSAELGLDVTLVEAAAFPRVKVCGEFVSPAATAALESLASPATLRDAGAGRVDTLVLERGDRSNVFAMPAPAWVLSRRSLDDLLVQHATEAGVRVLQPARVTSVVYKPDHAIVHARRTDATPRDAGGSNLRIRASLVVHADGAGRHAPGNQTSATRATNATENPARSAPSRVTPKRPGVIGLKCHLVHDASRFTTQPGALRMRAAAKTPGATSPIGDLLAGGGAYLGYAPIEHGEATAAMVVRDEIVKRVVQRVGAIDGAGGDALLAAMLPGYNASQRRSRVLTCGVAGSGYIDDGYARSVRVGNAAAAVEPVGGEGIGLALWAGRTLAASLADAAQAQRAGIRDAIIDNATLRAMHTSYAQRYRRRIRLRRPACRAAAWVLERRWASGAVWPLIAPRPIRTPMLTAWYRATGKPA